MAGSMLGMTPDELSRPFIDFHTKLAGSDSQEWWDGFKRFLRKENPWPTSQTAQVKERTEDEWGPVTLATELRFLATVTLGLHKNGKAHKKSVESRGHKVSDWSSDLLVHSKTKFTCANKEEQWDLYAASNRDMGFTKRATRERIYARMFSPELSWNIEKLPAEIGPALRVEYTDQPCGEWLLVSMDPLTDSVGDLDLFRVERHGDGESWLLACNGNPDRGWDPEVLWVVGRRKSA